jgi:hypothetical protein
MVMLGVVIFARYACRLAVVQRGINSATIGFAPKGDRA